jgi:hypothetical protein
MPTNRLGCLSPLAILGTLLTLAALVAAEFFSGNSLFAPGALNAEPGGALRGHISHAEFAKECGLCHAAPWSAQGMSDLCQTCHTSIAAELENPTSLHGAIVDRHTGLECRTCHPEHRGPHASLTLATEQDFPHEVVGFALNAHNSRSPGIPFTCADCHTTNLDAFIPQTCLDCHKQLNLVFSTAHVLEFGLDCLACHDGIDRYGQFSHRQTQFDLTGKHSQTICSKCHLNARTQADLQHTPTSCPACHLSSDPHSGRFGQECGTCHNPNGWSDNVKFDHTLASFQLEGDHAEVACEACHLNRQFQGTPSDCFSCHKQIDAHRGEFGTDCAVCHNPSSWDNVRVDHDSFNFKLTGAHLKTECTACHQNGVFTNTPSDCFACHQNKDEHQGRFGTDCATCHSTTAWEPATFDHNRSNFPLTGAHSSTACESCHKNGKFQGLPSTCASCHGDPAFHAGLFRGQDCSACHSTSTWVPGEFNGSHPGITDEGGSGVNHGGQGCRSCHTVNLNTATCTACHDSNNPDGKEGGND